jgi:hypothetical protein
MKKPARRNASKALCAYSTSDICHVEDRILGCGCVYTRTHTLKYGYLLLELFAQALFGQAHFVEGAN